ncbi:NACHT, LRR and PYD domains-containing protein 12-like isoform X2 [Sardina pilchardus]|uniref:NACHT, LRR and PYD domains-containing protein 12-like isoform X2 n=2 Tax=Sardina pilchardus TaxID=27697 RepID=UPI002E151633
MSQLNPGFEWRKDPATASRGCEASRAAGLNMANVTAQPGGMESTLALSGGAALSQQGAVTAALKEVLRKTLGDLTDADFKTFKHRLRDQGQFAWGELEKADRDETVDLLVQTYPMEAGGVMVTTLQKMNHNQLAIDLERNLATSGDQQSSAGGGGSNMSGAPAPQQAGDQQSSAVGGGINMNMSGAPVPQQGCGAAKSILKQKLKRHLRTKFSAVHQDHEVKNLDDIYTDLYIVEGCTGGVNSTHEVSTINMKQIGRGSSFDKHIQWDNMFTDRQITKLLTLGIAGVGKTVAVQKFVMDWTEGKTNKDIDFVFVLLFRELNLLKKSYTFLELLLEFYTELKDLRDFPQFTECKIIFVLDGLDESRLTLEFEKCISELNEKTSVDVLMTSLIKGKLLNSAHIWVTTRPAAASLIPDECFNLVTEVRGFNDDQKDQFFQKNINNPEKADKLITHVKKNRSLHIMCHIPVFCRIIASVVDAILADQSKDEQAKTLTETYTQYCASQMKRMNDKHLDKKKKMNEKKKGMLLVKLGKLAFNNLEKGNLIFYEKDFQDCGIDVKSGSLQAGVCTEIFKEEYAVAEEKIFSFVHLSVQEFLAALYVLHKNATCYLRNRIPDTWRKTDHWLYSPSRFDLYQIAVDKALQSQNGHLDLFVRFVLGLAPMLEPQIRFPLNKLLPQLAIRETSIENTVQYIKELIKRDYPPERTINLFHCLNELGDNSLVEEINGYINSADENKNLTPAQCSALAYLLLMSATDMEEFDLKKYLRSEEGLHRMLPVVTVSKRVWLNQCQLTKPSGKLLASVLQRTPSHLRELDMSDNDLQDKGVDPLFEALGDPQCKLEILRLVGCGLTEKSGGVLAFALQSVNSHLRELDLSKNALGDCGGKLGSGTLNPHCTMETLRLAGCKLSEKPCEVVASAVQHMVSLTELDLSDNHMNITGIQLLNAGMCSPNCKLQKLRLVGCGLTEKSGNILAFALQSVNSHLRQLDLSKNTLGDCGGKLGSGTLNPYCKMETLRLAGCKLSEKPCEVVASAVQHVVSLTELDLSGNHMNITAVQLLDAGICSPSCELQTLRLADCKLTEKSCEIVALALQSANSPLRELDLSQNDLQESGEKLLSALQSPKCKLETLRLVGCGLTEKSGGIVAFALQSVNSHLRDLDLSKNTLGDCGGKLGSEALNPHCKMETLRLAGCKLTEESCEVVASAVQHMVSLTELDLSDNHMNITAVQLLSAGISHSNCKLQILRLAGCKLPEESCEVVASAVQHMVSLTELDLSGNHLNIAGVHLSSALKGDIDCKLQILRHARGELRKYACELTLDPNTAHKKLSLSEGNRKVTCVSERQPYPDHPERFDIKVQVLCREGLTGRCYWEAELSGDTTDIAVAYKSIQRKGKSEDCAVGCNAKSWSLQCSGDGYSAYHNNNKTAIPAPSSRSSRVGVYLDWPAGTLSFYSVSSNTLTHLHTFHSTFTEPLYPGFMVWPDSSASLCQIT